MQNDGPAPPSLFYVEYKSAINGKVARFFVKIPRGTYRDSLYALNEAFARAQLKGQVIWFRVEARGRSTSGSRRGMITPEARMDLARWHEALARTTTRTKVVWE